MSCSCSYSVWTKECQHPPESFLLPPCSFSFHWNSFNFWSMFHNPLGLWDSHLLLLLLQSFFIQGTFELYFLTLSAAVFLLLQHTAQCWEKVFLTSSAQVVPANIQIQPRKYVDKLLPPSLGVSSRRFAFTPYGRMDFSVLMQMKKGQTCPD